MSGWTRNLVLLLVVQLALLAFFSYSNAPDSNDRPALLAVKSADITGLAVSDGDGNEASVQLQEGAWLLPSGLPASASKVTALLDKLTELSLSWPVSTRANAHERFEVADDKYQRRLSIAGGDGATLYFGTSPGYQQIHARGASDDVFAVKLATHDMPAEADDWLDKTLLQAHGDVTEVRWDGMTALTKAAQGWLLGKEPASAEAAKRAVSRLAELQVLGVLDEAPTAAPTDAKAILVTDSDGEYRISYWVREATNDYALMSTRFPGEAFRMSNYVAEQLTPSAVELVLAEVSEVPEIPGVDLADVLPDVPEA